MKNSVKNLRKKKGLTQLELAAGIGVSLATIQNWESDRHNISGKHVDVLCEFFNVTPNEIFGYDAMTPEWSSYSELYSILKAMNDEEKELFMAIAKTLFEFYRNPDSDIAPRHIQDEINEADFINEMSDAF